MAIATHLREVEGLGHGEIAERLGLSPKTVAAYFYDPDGSKARQVKGRYRGSCERCGRATSSGEGKGRARKLCRRCAGRLARVWDAQAIVRAMRRWKRRYGSLPSSYDWTKAHARRRGKEAIERLERGRWPPPSVVTRAFGSWAAAREAAERER